jgi:zinc D-Ala-D-Ala dipeptidase
MVKYVFFSMVGLFIWASCNSSNGESEQRKQAVHTELGLDSLPREPVTDVRFESQKSEIISDTSFVDILDVIEGIDLNIVYADTANFFHTALYPCEQCLLRYEVAVALKNVQQYIGSLGYTLQIYDCYRPFSIQEYMWDILPDSRYVANPNRGGSIHNKGGAVDLRLLYLNGDTVPMGTIFDHFGVEASHSYTDMPDSILQNRIFLKTAMEQFGFHALNTEWWHYTFNKSTNYPVAKLTFDCK